MLARRAYSVRKRWDGRRVYLIHLTDILEIDVLSEAVWDRLDGEHTVDMIVREIASSFQQFGIVELEAVVSANILNFEQCGFLE